MLPKQRKLKKIICWLKNLFTYFSRLYFYFKNHIHSKLRFLNYNSCRLSPLDYSAPIIPNSKAGVIIYVVASIMAVIVVSAVVTFLITRKKQHLEHQPSETVEGKVPEQDTPRNNSPSNFSEDRFQTADENLVSANMRRLKELYS